ncbi:MAG: endolytic transglycosylase MltG [Flavobacterium sp.]
MNYKKILLYISLAFLVVVSFLGFRIYQIVFTPNTSFEQKEVFVFIPTGTTFGEVQEILQPFISDWGRFESLAERRGYAQNVLAGKFKLERGMHNHALIQALRRNVPVKVTFNNQERLEDFCKRISTQLEVDSLTLYQAFTEPAFMDEYQKTEENVFTLLIPNTFEFYWNVSPEQFRNRLAKQYVLFWNEERLQKAEALGLTTAEVSILASIVQKETAKVDERSTVAGVYLNRLKKGMLLQADPTVIFAYKMETGDFEQIIKRVYYKHLEVDSPYNTYKYTGLPPGPIFMPDVSSIEAVLNPQRHDFIYFCARVDRLGYHEFATTLEQHNRNKSKYVAWLKQQGL